MHTPLRSGTSALSTGRPVVLVQDDSERDPPAQLLISAEHASAESIAFMVRHTAGYIRVALPDTDADRLNLPVMHPPGLRLGRSADAVSIDAAHGISTGISANDRARTIRLLADPTTTPGDLARPGHVVPVRVALSTVDSPVAASAAIDLAGMGGLQPVVAVSALVSAANPILMMGVTEARTFAARHDLAVVSIREVANALSPPRRNLRQPGGSSSVTVFPAVFITRFRRPGIGRRR